MLFRYALKALEALGAEVVELGVKPNGRNINLKCGSTAPESLARAVVGASARWWE